ncbi:MAG: substrate-binding domain-containing protein [Phycisphaeraceae bacterium]
MHRVAEALRQAVQRGQWSEGARLPTTRQLAEQFEVSLNTVQGALRELEMQGLIERRARVGTFVRSRAGRGKPPRARRNGRQIAVLWSNLARDPLQPKSDGWAQQIVYSAEEKFAQAGYHLTLVADRPARSGDALEPVERLRRFGGDLAGVFGFASPQLESLLEPLDDMGVPWLTVKPRRPQSVDNFISADNFTGGRLVGRAFAAMQCRHVLLIGDRCNKQSEMDKMHGLLQGYIEGGGSLRHVEYVHRDNATEPVGYRYACEHLDKHGVPDAVFTAGDYLAVGVMRACRERGIAVPGQVAIVGSTGLMFGRYTHPALTTLAQPMDAMGEALAETLMQMVEQGTTRASGRYIPCELVVRESCVLPVDLWRALEREYGSTCPIRAETADETEIVELSEEG